MSEIEFINIIDEYKMPKFAKKRMAILESKIRTLARQKAKEENCELCGKKCSSFCNSHSLPRFILKEMSKNGKVISGHALFASEPNVKETGLNNCLTFDFICDDCDNKYFKNYENIKSADEPVTSVIMNEIALKNHLKYLYKRKFDKQRYLAANEIMGDPLHNDPFVGGQRISNNLLLCDLDINDTKKKVDFLKKNLEKDNYYLIDEIVLPYRTKIAFQGTICPVAGFSGDIINKSYCYEENNKLELLHVAIFPIKEKTKIIVFTKDGNNQIKKFYKPYRKLNLEEKLYSLNYLILLTQEEWCINPGLNIKDLNDETIYLINQSDVSFYTKTYEEMINGVHKEKLIMQNLDPIYTIKTSGNIYNFLSE